MSGTCTVCNLRITRTRKEGLTCSVCFKSQHFQCLELTEEKRNDLLSGKINFLCTSCESKRRRSSNLHATATPEVTKKVASSTDKSLALLLASIDGLKEMVRNIESKTTDALLQIEALKKSSLSEPNDETNLSNYRPGETSLTTQLSLFNARFAAVEAKSDTTLRGLAEIRVMLTGSNASARTGSLLPAPKTFCHCETQTDFVTSSDFVCQTDGEGIECIGIPNDDNITDSVLIITPPPFASTVSSNDARPSETTYPSPNERTPDGGVWMTFGSSRYLAKDLGALKKLKTKISKRAKRQEKRREKRKAARLARNTSSDAPSPRSRSGSNTTTNATSGAVNSTAAFSSNYAKSSESTVFAIISVRRS